jgi:hypothetical protein
MIASLGRLPDPRFMLEVYFIEPYIFGSFIQTVVSFFKKDPSQKIGSPDVGLLASVAM